LLCIGELGHVAVTNKISYSFESIKDLILQCFDENSEEIKSAAAYALGHVAVGNMNNFLPFILEKCHDTSSKNQYLLLTSLKEIVLVHANNQIDLAQHLTAILQELQFHCQANETISNLVAECFGALTNIYPATLVPLLISMGKEKSHQKVVFIALKFTLSRDLPLIHHDVVRQLVEFCFTSINEADLDVKTAILVMINAAVHHNPSVVEQFVLTTISPYLIEMLRFKKEREIDLGAFKEKFDDGLPLRKLSLTCIDTILDTYPDLLDIMGFVQCLSALLEDKDEIKTQTHQVIQKIIPRFSNAVISVLETLIVPLKKSVESLSKLKEEVVGPERERVHETVKSALRVIIRINSIDDVTNNRNYLDFFEKTVKNVATITEIYNSLTGKEEN
jgi:cullin-associated NEDD8-dissociated protein 1